MKRFRLIAIHAGLGLALGLLYLSCALLHWRTNPMVQEADRYLRACAASGVPVWIGVETPPGQPRREPFPARLDDYDFAGLFEHPWYVEQTGGGYQRVLLKNPTFDPVYRVALTPDARAGAAGSPSGVVRVVRAERGFELWLVPGMRVGSVWAKKTVGNVLFLLGAILTALLLAAYDVLLVRRGRSAGNAVLLGPPECPRAPGARVSLLFGALSLVPILGFPLSVLACLKGADARGLIRSSPGKWRGYRAATAGLVLGCLSMTVSMLLLVAIVGAIILH
jgi:hypothetical protein